MIPTPLQQEKPTDHSAFLTLLEQEDFVPEQSAVGDKSRVRFPRRLDPIVSVEPTNEREQMLAAVLRELAALPPRSRTVRRHQWLESLGDRRDWVRVARSLHATDPQLCDLDPILLDWLVRYPRADVMVRNADPGEPFEWGQDFDEVSTEAYRARKKARKEERKQKREEREGRWIVIVSVGLLGALIVLGIWEFINRSVNGPRPTEQKYQNAPAIPAVPPRNVSFPKTEFTPDDIIAFLDYDPNAGKPPPPKYTMFILMGGKSKLEELRRNPEFIRLRKEMELAKEKLRKAEDDVRKSKATLPAPTRR